MSVQSRTYDGFSLPLVPPSPSRRRVRGEGNLATNVDARPGQGLQPERNRRQGLRGVLAAVVAAQVVIIFLVVIVGIGSRRIAAVMREMNEGGDNVAGIGHANDGAGIRGNIVETGDARTPFVQILP